RDPPIDRQSVSQAHQGVEVQKVAYWWSAVLYPRCLRLLQRWAGAVHQAAPASVVLERPLLKPSRCRKAKAAPGRKQCGAESLGKETASALQRPGASLAALLPARNACRRAPEVSHHKSPQPTLGICADLETIQ